MKQQAASTKKVPRHTCLRIEHDVNFMNVFLWLPRNILLLLTWHSKSTFRKKKQHFGEHKKAHYIHVMSHIISEYYNSSLGIEMCKREQCYLLVRINQMHPYYKAQNKISLAINCQISIIHDCEHLNQLTKNGNCSL